jgi:hypothetical protein
MMENLNRYLRVGGHFDAVFSRTNGIPQGCSLSLLIANLYVTTLFNMLEKNILELKWDRSSTTAILDTPATRSL